MQIQLENVQVLCLLGYQFRSILTSSQIKHEATRQLMAYEKIIVEGKIIAKLLIPSLYKSIMEVKFCFSKISEGGEN